MSNEWIEGERNYIEWQQLEGIDMDELLFISSLDEYTTFITVDKVEDNTVMINTSMEYGFTFSFQEDEEGLDDVYVKPYAELQHFRKFDTSPYDLELVHQFLQEDALNQQLVCHQDHDEPAMYLTTIGFPSVRVEAPSGITEVTDTLYRVMKNVLKQGEKMFAQAVIRSIDHSIQESYELRKQYEQKIAE